MTLTAVSLFDGIGGFLLAFQRAGAELVASCEIDPAAAAVSKRHFPDVHQFTDVTELTGDDLRAVGFVPERGVITAGWPCQDLSVAGRRAGLDGARSGLWWEVVRLLQETQARWFLGENVPGLLSSNGGRDMGAVVGALGELGYGVAYRVLDAQFFGVPQRRRRVFFVAHLGEPWSAPAEVLFELAGSAGDSAAGGETGPAATGTVAEGAGEPCSVFNTHTHTLTASASKMVVEDGTGRGCPIVTHADDRTVAAGAGVACDLYNGAIDGDVTHSVRVGNGNAMGGVPAFLATHTHNGFDVAGRRETRIPHRRRISSDTPHRHGRWQR